MLILHTPRGKVTVAKGNIHTIHQDLRGRMTYVTKDLIGIPFKKINGHKVKTLEEAFKLISEYADETGIQPIDIHISEEDEKEVQEMYQRWHEKAEEAKKEYAALTQEERDNLWPVVKDLQKYDGLTLTLTITSEDGVTKTYKSDQHRLKENENGNLKDKVLYFNYHPNRRAKVGPIPIKAINGIPVTSAKQGIEIIKDDSKPFNRLKNLTIRTINKLKNYIKRRINK